MARKEFTQRRRALDVVFEAEQRDILVPGLLRELLAERRTVSTSQVPIQELGAVLVELVADHLYEIDEMIDSYSKWGLRRLSSIDRTVLRLGIGEIVFAGVPVGEAVSDYSQIIRELGTEKSIGFITAIFNRAKREAEKKAAEAAAVDKPDEAAVAADTSAAGLGATDGAATSTGIGDSDVAASSTDAPVGDEATRVRHAEASREPIQDEDDESNEADHDESFEPDSDELIEAESDEVTRTEADESTRTELDEAAQTEQDLSTGEREDRDADAETLLAEAEVDREAVGEAVEADADITESDIDPGEVAEAMEGDVLPEGELPSDPDAADLSE